VSEDAESQLSGISKMTVILMAASVRPWSIVETIDKDNEMS